MSSGCLARIQMLLTLKVLLKGANSVNSELIECNLAAVLSVSCR